MVIRKRKKEFGQERNRKGRERARRRTMITKRKRKKKKMKIIACHFHCNRGISLHYLFRYRISNIFDERGLGEMEEGKREKDMNCKYIKHQISSY